MRFAIFTHVLHTVEAGSYSAYSPYVREMNLWLRHVDKVEIVAPVQKNPKEEFSAKDSYQHSHIVFTKIPDFNLFNFISTVKAFFKIPLIMLRITVAMNRADHLHLRCPGNIGLLACICQIFFPRKTKSAKYAGNWDPEAHQPWTYRIQKWILTNTFLTKNINVLVYGNWSDQSENILPFFTASFSENEIERIQKDFNSPYKFLFVGNLVPGKRPQMAIQLAEALKEKNIPAQLYVYGDGVLKNELEFQAKNKSYIHLYGNQPLNVVKEAYKEFHFLFLASKSEGWPKAVAEAMFFGCIPVASGVSCVPWMLGGGSRGILISEGKEMDWNQVKSGKWKKDSPHVLEEAVDKIMELLKDPEEMQRISREAQEWSQEYTLEKFEEAIKKILVPKDTRP